MMPEHFKQTLLGIIRSMPDYNFIWRHEYELEVAQSFTNLRIIPWLQFRSLLSKKFQKYKYYISFQFDFDFKQWYSKLF